MIDEVKHAAVKLEDAVVGTSEVALLTGDLLGRVH